MALTRPLEQSVVVLTGASSGIGAVTAMMLARRGARLVLTARGADALGDVATAIERHGGEVAIVAADIAEPEAAEEVALTAQRVFGRLDAWVNNAGVSVYGRAEDIDVADYQRVLEVDVLGYVQGVRAALPRLRAAGGGVVVNNASVLGRVPIPFQAPYVMAKHAVVAFSDVLRQELRLAGERHIAIATVLPATVDTPFYDQAGNHTGRRPRPMPPAYSPDVAARAIVRMLQRPRRETHAGWAGALLHWQHRLAPGLTEWLLARYAGRAALGPEPARDTHGNLYAPSESVGGPANGRARNG